VAHIGAKSLTLGSGNTKSPRDKVFDGERGLSVIFIGKQVIETGCFDKT
jgi:hypothetical protein